MNQEPTRECCEKCKDWEFHYETTCLCHSIKPPVCEHKNISKEITAPYNLVCNDCLEVISIKPPVEECEGCKNKTLEIEHTCGLYGELSPEVGDFRWKDTKGKVKGEVLAKDYENWLEKNAYNLECWTGEEWKSLVSPELSWDIKSSFEANFLDGDKINDCGGSTFSAIGALDVAEFFYEQGKEQAFNSSRASMVEIIEGMKKPIPASGYDPSDWAEIKRNKIHNSALDDILQALKNKENE